MTITTKANSGTITSENVIIFSRLSFWHSNTLNTNNKTMDRSDDNSRITDDLSLYIRTYTMITKYAHSPSQINRGMNASYQVQCIKSSYFKTARKEKTRMDTRCNQTSSTVIPTHFRISSSLNSMVFQNIFLFVYTLMVQVHWKFFFIHIIIWQFVKNYKFPTTLWINSFFTPKIWKEKASKLQGSEQHLPTEVLILWCCQWRVVENFNLVLFLNSIWCIVVNLPNRHLNVTDQIAAQSVNGKGAWVWTFAYT
jgi:hypothetical protein